MLIWRRKQGYSATLQSFELDTTALDTTEKMPFHGAGILRKYPAPWNGKKETHQTHESEIPNQKYRTSVN
jgi:hypothetical protein